MKRIILIIILVSIPGLCFGQTTTFDLAGFTPPTGWETTVQDEMLILKSPPNDSGSFCLISIYKGLSGSGDLSTDFTNAWSELVAKMLSVKDKPQNIEKSPPENGWDSQTGTVKFSRPTGTFMALLTTLTSYHKSMSILVVTDSQSYQKELEGFYNSVSMTKVDEKQNTDQTDKTPVSQGGGAGGLGDYLFTPPPGFTKEEKANEIVLREPSVPMTISVLPMQPSSGNLETDMNRLFFSVFRDWQDYKSMWGNEPSTHKGTTADGYNYIIEHRDIQQKNNSETQLSATVLLIQANDQVAVIAGSYKQKSAALASNLISALNDQYTYILHSFSFKNYKPVPPSISIIGKWKAMDSTAASFYEFFPNGTFGWGGGTSFRTTYDDTRDKVTTTTWAHDGKWSLKGNEITIYLNSTKKTDKGKLRIFYEKKYDGRWAKRLGWLKFKDGGGFYEVSYAPDEN